MTRTVRFVLAAVIGLAYAAPAFGQGEPRVTVAGGYAFLQQRSAGDLENPAYPLGWMAGSTFRLGSNRLAAAAEFGVSSRKNAFDETQRLTGVLGGARFTLVQSRRVRLFAQALAGLERFSEPGLTESGLAVQPGGGIDLHLSARWFIRAQGDYRWSQTGDATFHAYRIAAGLGWILSR
jgi:hypothetical protein